MGGVPSAARPPGARAAGRMAPAGIFRPAPHLLLDAQQLVVLGDAVAAARRAGLDLARPTCRRPDPQWCVSSVSPERCEMIAGVAGGTGHGDGVERLGHRADLIQLHQERVARTFSRCRAARISGLVTNTSSPTSCTRVAERDGQRLPAVPVAFRHAVLDRDDRVPLPPSSRTSSTICGGGAGARPTS